MRLVSLAENRRQRDLRSERTPARARARTEYSRWSEPGTREERMASTGVPVVMPIDHVPGAFRCVKCRADVSGSGLFCDFHLWNLDNPMLQAVRS